MQQGLTSQVANDGLLAKPHFSPNRSASHGMGVLVLDVHMMVGFLGMQCMPCKRDAHH